GLPSGVGAINAQATGISGDGQLIAGDYGVAAGSGRTWMLTSSGMTALPMIAVSYIHAVSSDGSTILGQDADTANDLGYYLTAAAELVVPAPASFQGPYYAASAYGISGDGKTMCGAMTTGSINPTIPFIYLVGDITSNAELFFSPTDGFVDFSNAPNRRLFISDRDSPAFMGTHGELPLGHQPSLYLTTDGSQDPTRFARNSGQGGNFAITDGIEMAPGGLGCTTYVTTFDTGSAAD